MILIESEEDEASVGTFLDLIKELLWELKILFLHMVIYTIK
jgi:hypothetical protein